jgi:hypothetical protein
MVVAVADYHETSGRAKGGKIAGTTAAEDGVSSRSVYGDTGVSCDVQKD